MTNAAFYNELADTALELLTEFGRPVTLRSFTPGSGGRYDPSTGKAAVSSQTQFQDETRNAVVVDAPANRIGPQYGTKNEEGTLIPDDNKWIYMDAKGSKPKMQDHVILDNKTFRIFNMQSIGPGGIPLLYLLVLKA